MSAGQTSGWHSRELDSADRNCSMLITEMRNRVIRENVNLHKLGYCTTVLGLYPCRTLLSIA